MEDAFVKDPTLRAKYNLVQSEMELEYKQAISNSATAKTAAATVYTVPVVFHIFNILIQVFKNRNGNDIIYLSLAESFFGNLRDLFIYGICYKSRHKIFVHMLGGAGMKEILSGSGIQKKINVF